MSCGEVIPRQDLQEEFIDLNPGAAAAIQRMVRSVPDPPCFPHSAKFCQRCSFVES